MDRTERFYKIDSLLQGGKAVPVERMLRELEVSLATFKRDLEYMRDRFHAPIVWDREARGYHFAATAAARTPGPPGTERLPVRAEGPRFELPGLWFNASEIRALLTMQHAV